MSDAESELERIAGEATWRLDNLQRLRGAMKLRRDRVTRVRDAIRNGDWESRSADAASARLSGHERTLDRLDGFLQHLEKTISGHDERVRDQARKALASLPLGGLPTTVRDAIDRGHPEAMTPYGLIALGTGPVGLAIASQFFEQARREAAEAALDEVKQSVGECVKELNEVSGKFKFDTVPYEGDESGGEDGGSPGEIGDGRNNPAFPRPGGGGGTFPQPGGGNSGGGLESDPNSPGRREPDGPSGGGGGGENPQRPDWPWVRPEPPIGDPGHPGGDGPNDGPGGSNGSGGGDLGRRPSVDSNLDGSAMRSGLGAAGLGAAGLAAGAKLASGGGAGSGLGAVGQGGIAAGGSGLRGAASVAGSGASAATSGSSNSSGAARGGRPGGMMMGGGGAGGGAEKKSAKSGLGGYIAPKLEDEGDGGPAARASRAGGRQAEE